VVPRIEGAVDAQALMAMTRDYQERVAPSVLRDLGARCTARDSVELQPRIVGGKLLEVGIPAMVWTTEATVEPNDPGSPAELNQH
jgi:hypothetical protein